MDKDLGCRTEACCRSGGRGRERSELWRKELGMRDWGSAFIHTYSSPVLLFHDAVIMSGKQHFKRIVVNVGKTGL